MFTGIIEAPGIIESATSNGENYQYWISSPISDEFRIDQSVAHNGVCLTVDALEPGRHRVTAIAETLAKTNLRDWRAGTITNLERSMIMNGRLDGHIVQGHVDATGLCISRTDASGSFVFSFRFPDEFRDLVVEKGSICLNGISLTIFNVGENTFSVAIIPYTWENTNLNTLEVGGTVNLEFDIFGKYAKRILGYLR